MTRVSQHIRLPSRRQSLRRAVLCGAAVVLIGLGGGARAEPIILGGSGKPAIEINRGALEAIRGAGMPVGGLRDPGPPAAERRRALQRPAAAATAEPARPQASVPMPALSRPVAPSTAPAQPPAPAPTAQVRPPPPPPPPIPTVRADLPSPSRRVVPPPPPPQGSRLVPAPAPAPAVAPANAAAPVPVPPAGLTPAPADAPAPAPLPAAPAVLARAPALPQVELSLQPSEAGPMFALTFEPGDAELSDMAKAQISAMAAKVKSEGARLQLKAFASGTAGNSSQARRTSLARALAVRSYFIQEGLRSSLIDVRALGEPKDGSREDRVDVILLEK